jgi:hypothetical protein
VGYAQEATPTLTTIYSFGTSATDGVTPISLIRGDKGVLYGVTAYGGTFWGTIFRLTPPAAGQTNWTEKILHTFTRTANDGGQPSGGLVLDSEGNLYGVTTYGGTVFELSPPAVSGGDWTQTILYNFPYGGSLNNPRTLASLGFRGKPFWDGL